MDTIRYFYWQNCKKIQKIKTFKAIFNEFWEIYFIKMILFHINSRKTIPYICKWHIKNIYRNFISKIKSKSQNITNISYQKFVKFNIFLGHETNKKYHTCHILHEIGNLWSLTFFVLTLKNNKFNNILMRHISNVLTFRLYFRNKISIYNVFNMSFTNIWYSFSWIYVNRHFLENNMK